MVNDISIASGIIIVFILVGAFLPALNAEFGSDDTTVNANTLDSEVKASMGDFNESVKPSFTRPTASFKFFAVMGSIAKMFFWTFGGLPTWLDLIVFIPMRLLLAFIIARNAWIGGGG